MNIDKHRNEKVWPPGFPQGITEQWQIKMRQRKSFCTEKKNQKVVLMLLLHCELLREGPSCCISLFHQMSLRKIRRQDLDAYLKMEALPKKETLIFVRCRQEFKKNHWSTKPQFCVCLLTNSPPSQLPHCYFILLLFYHVSYLHIFVFQIKVNKKL